MEIPVLGPTRGRLSFLQPILHAFHMCQSTACAEATKLNETGFFVFWFACFLSNLAENFKYLNISPNSLHNEWKSKSGSTFNSLNLSRHCKVYINKGLTPLFWVYNWLMEPLTCNH